jgi:hypothetical protein
MPDRFQVIVILVAVGLVGLGAMLSLKSWSTAPAAPQTTPATQASPPTDLLDLHGGAGRRYTARAREYPWLPAIDQADLLANRIPAPGGFDRVPADAGCFASWLRRLPLKKGCPPVLQFDGKPKGNQDAHVAVVDMDVGSADLQQCADAIIRLRAEYLWAVNRRSGIRFGLTSGAKADWLRWSQGNRPRVSGGSVRWTRSAAPDGNYSSFRKYLEMVFTYAGTLSLARELEPVIPADNMQIGDVFVQGGSPGHAMIVVDMAVNYSTGKRLFLLAQSYMPAQEVHILKNPPNAALSPWYELSFGDTLVTPEWKFRKDDLKKFPSR